FGAQLMERAFQALALFVSADLARNADVFDRRHVDDVTARQRHVGSDASAFLADRLFGDLDDDLLSLAQKVGYHRARKAVSRTGTGEGRRLLRLVISFFIAPFFDAEGRLRSRGGARAVSGAAAASTATARSHFTPARTLTNSCNRVSQLIHDAPFLPVILLRLLGRCFERRLG